MTSAPAIGFDYRPSRLPRQLLGAVAVLALLSVVLSGLTWQWKIVLATGTLVASLRTLGHLARSLVAGVGLSGSVWTLYAPDRTESAATLASCRVLGSLVLLRLDVSGRTETLLLARDNSDADLRRRLRMRLAVLRGAESTEES